MNDSNAFERFVADQFDRARDTDHATDPLLDDINLQATRTHQRPRWLALIKEPPMRISSNLVVGSPTVRVAAIMVATLLVALTLAGAGLAGARLLAADEENGGPITIGFSNMYEGDPFFGEIGNGVRAAATEAGIELLSENADGSVTAQEGHIDGFVEDGAGAIIVVPTEPNAIVDVIARANDAGVPVLTVDRNVAGGEVAAFVATDNVAGGRTAGEFLVEAIGGAGKVYEMQGGSESSSVDRGTGFAEALEAAPEVIKVGEKKAWGDPNSARQYTLDLLEADPEVTGIFAHNDAMATGVLEALDQLGLIGEITVVGFDVAPYAVEFLESGALSASIAQDPPLMGRTALETAIAAARGEAVEAFVPVATELVTGETIGEYLADQ